MIRDYKWLFDKQGKVREGLECVLRTDDWYNNEYKLVKLAGYWPYYTNGSADPTIDEVCESNYIEIDGDVDDLQVQLNDLFPIIPTSKEVVYNGQQYNQVGESDDLFESFVVIKKPNGEKKVVESYEIQPLRHINDLNYDELAKLFKSIGFGSIYLSDYNNSLGVPNNEVYAIAEGFTDELYREYGEQYENYINEVEFADYCCC